ncbi:MAG: hypothetical protein IJP03_06540 [Christensenellaceae bacterium]|nr:hypothetical protein [Christensenellaceae bacterium]
MERSVSAQEEILLSAAKTGKLAQAYLISAPGAALARSKAKHFIKSLFCVSGDACGRCLECRKFEDGNQVEYMAVGEGDEIPKMEHVRSIPDFLSKRSMGGRKVVFLADAHRFSARIQNFLLKSIEEPQEGVVFVLATHQPERLLPTILSRCIWVRISPLSRGELAAQLRGLVRDELVEMLAAQGGGSKDQALRLAADEDWLNIRKDAADICRQLLDRRPALAQIEGQMMAHEKRIRDLLMAMSSLIRDALHLKLTGCSTWLQNPDMAETVEELAEGFTIGALRYIIESIMDRTEKKQDFPGYKTKLLVEGLLFEIMEEKTKWQK